MNILDRYGIKEVADVTFYEIDKDSGQAGAPVLYLDTLKVSTIEQTAENTSARGGKGNPELIMWDYGKEITVTLEDALFSAKSMALMYGIEPEIWCDKFCVMGIQNCGNYIVCYFKSGLLGYNLCVFFNNFRVDTHRINFPSRNISHIIL